MGIISVAVPGPWWTHLSYKHEDALRLGTRVRVPLGRSLRVGLTVPAGHDDAGPELLKEINDLIDIVPPLPDDLWNTILWFSKTWFAGTGMAAKSLLPARFFNGEPLEEVSYPDHGNSPSVRYVYEPKDDARAEIYKGLIEKSERCAIVVFPEVAAAKRFWESLPEGLKKEGVLWPELSNARQWDLWKRSRTGDFRFAVGCQTVSFIPLSGLSTVIIDEENSGALRTQKHPEFHHRTLLAARARFAGADLVLGGRMPSAKVFRQMGKESGRTGIRERLIFVDMRDSSSFEFAGIKDRLPVSRPLLRETEKTLGNGGWAFWILDRKGYAGEIFCEDCGLPVRCPKCGGVMRWEGKAETLKCLDCGMRGSIPERCPSCRGPFLEGQRPGLEALEEKACKIFGKRYVLLQSDEKNSLPCASALLKDHPDGGLILGTRKLISLSDDIPPHTVGWIDADAEARVQEYDAKAKAFSLMWESAWRGPCPEKRKIVIQSRRPDKSWQQGLNIGWRHFWERELKERMEWQLPPFMPILKIDVPAFKRKRLASDLEAAGFDNWESEDRSDQLWVRTKRFEELRCVLGPYFEIDNTRSGIPKVSIKLD